MISRNILPKWARNTFSLNVKFGFLDTLGDMFGLGGKQKSGGTSQRDPWGPQQEYLKELFAEAQDLYKQGQPEYYGGQLVPQQNSNLNSTFANPTVQADGQFLDGLRGNTASLSNQNTVFDQATMDTVSNNPFLQKQIDAMSSDVNRNASTQIAQNNMNAGMNGTTGSSSAGIQNALVQQDANRQITNASTAMRSNAFNQGVNAGFQGANNRMTSLGMQSANNMGGLRTLYDQSQQNYQNTMAAGMAEYGLNQDSINAELKKWDYTANAKMNNLTNYRNMIMGNYGGTTTNNNWKDYDSAKRFMDLNDSVFSAIGQFF